MRPWRADDAELLHPILEVNWDHLGPWIPARVATPAPVPVLAERLAGFEKEFEADREWRFAIFNHETGDLLGEAALFPRSAAGRVHVAYADRVELGYWLRADETGRGFITEAARALLIVAANTARFSHVEIRCDARNTASGAVAQRLGFTLEETRPRPGDAEDKFLQVWSN